MTRPSEDFDDPIRTIGHDSTSTFDDTASDPTAHAGSEAQASATDVEGEADPVSMPYDAVEPVGLDATNDGGGLDDEEDDVVDDSAEGADDEDELLSEDDDLDADDEDADLDSETSPQTSVGAGKGTVDDQAEDAE